MPANVAVIAGCSQGIGLQFARAYLTRTSMNIIALSRSPDDARSAILQGQKDPQSRLTTLHFDATDEQTLEQAAHRVKEEHGSGSLRLLLNVAGVLHAEKSITQVSQELALDSFKINTLLPLLAFKHFVPLLPDGSESAGSETYGGLMPRDLSVLASLSARVGSIEDNRRGGWYSYRGSKAAQNQITRTLSHELKLRKKPAIALGLHPGTVVRTALSEPFTSKSQVDPEKGVFEAHQAAANLMDVIGSRQDSDSGLIFDWAGKQIPW